jgi:hypothetical protein
MQVWQRSYLRLPPSQDERAVEDFGDLSWSSFYAEWLLKWAHEGPTYNVCM